MKNLSLLVIGLIVSFSAFSQEKMNITICEKPANTISITHLIDCKLLSVDNPNYKINSFAIGWLSGNDYLEGMMNGNVVSDEIIESIKNSNPDIIYIEQILVINKKGKTLRLPQFTVNK